MDDYDKRVAQLERERIQSEKGRAVGAANQTRALLVGLALGAIGFVLAGVGGAGVFFVCGAIAAAWVREQRD
jgi:hypothetical protein